jgi:hypothetical protein
MAVKQTPRRLLGWLLPSTMSQHATKTIQEQPAWLLQILTLVVVQLKDKS